MMRSWIRLVLLGGLLIAAGCSSGERDRQAKKEKEKTPQPPPLLNTQATTGPVANYTPPTPAPPLVAPTAETNLAPLTGATATPVAAAQPVFESQPVALPERQPEIISTEPSPEYLWIPGNWERTADQWQWVPGEWKKAPFNNARWVNGYWKYQSGQYVWSGGHWAVAEPGQGMVVDKPIQPPPLPVESTAAVAVSPPPSPSHRWVPGHWDWVNGWWWFVPGHFTLVPDPQAVWVPGEWKKGLLGQWRWIAGHWELKEA